MPLNKHGKKALQNFIDEYGDEEKATSIFYAYMNKNPEMKEKQEKKTRKKLHKVPKLKK